MEDKTINLKLSLDTKSGVPFYKQIIQQIEYAVSAGHLAPGDKLPTVRALAIELKVNPNTVAKSYQGLELRGLVNTQVGSGTFISDKKVNISEMERKNELDALFAGLFTHAHALGFSKEEVLKYIKIFGE